jgi:ParB-like chromosome segregation protein Spo0J
MGSRMTSTKITINPEYDKQVPKLSEQEYNSLMESIKEYGQLSPILVNQDGVVLDGHHRFRICQDLGIEPQYRVIPFDDKVDERLFVSKSNLEGKGRHLNNFRRTELALKSKSDLREIARRNSKASLKQNQDRNQNQQSPSPTVRNLALGRVDEEIAKMASVSRDTVSKVEKIIKSLEEEDLEKLRSEEISINQAYNEILNQEWRQKVYHDIESLRPQIESIIEEYRKSEEEFFGQLFEMDQGNEVNSNNNTNLSVQQEEYISNNTIAKCGLGMKYFYLKIICYTFSRLLSTPLADRKRTNPKSEMSKALDAIQKWKKLVAERKYSTATTN